MKVETPQIVWHCGPDGKNAAVLSVDVLSSSGSVTSSPSSSSTAAATASTTVQLSTPAIIATGSTGDEDGVHLWRLRDNACAHDASVPSSGSTTTSNKQSVAAAQEATPSGSVPNTTPQQQQQPPAPSTAPAEHVVSLNRTGGGGMAGVGAINVLRFSPDGLHLACAGDGGSVVIWSVPMAKRGGGNGRHYWSEVTKDTDLFYSVLTQQCEDIMDLTWHPDSSRFAVASLDHSVLIFEDMGTGQGVVGGTGRWKCVTRNRDHFHYVQGAAFDPLGVYLATQGADRTVRVHSRKRAKSRKAKKDPAVSSVTEPSSSIAVNFDAKFELGRMRLIKHFTFDAAENLETSSQADCDVAEAGMASEEGGVEATPPIKKKPVSKQALYADESVKSFFRRLAWTPDGAFLITPAGIWRNRKKGASSDGNEEDIEEEPSFATHIFARHRFDRPHIVLTLKKPSVAVRANPLRYALPDGMSTTSHSLPYRIIFCVLTLDTILVYDTVQSRPIAAVGGAHYAGLTDCCWTDDGTVLIVTSSDGYVSFVSFGENELGVPYVEKTEKGCSKGSGLSRTSSSGNIVEGVVSTAAESGEYCC
mmetsp:Transcript_21965/g.50065  ORF Transcript_21965/g.50065 Transcript_21965/m.50065 type:complete len:588 (-) Transcript_21965:408-2171(-)